MFLCLVRFRPTPTNDPNLIYKISFEDDSDDSDPNIKIPNGDLPSESSI